VPSTSLLVPETITNFSLKCKGLAFFLTKDVNITHMKTSLLVTIIAFPTIASAQGLQQYIPTVISFVSDTLIPVILAIAFLFVVFNAIRYSVLEGTNPESREKAKGLMLYSVLAFVLIIIFWGVINLLVSGTGLGGATPPTPDFEKQFSPSPAT
jgi:hypothetical protein